jgi:hypothetical protein
MTRFCAVWNVTDDIFYVAPEKTDDVDYCLVGCCIIVWNRHRYVLVPVQSQRERYPPYDVRTARFESLEGGDRIEGFKIIPFVVTN